MLWRSLDRRKRLVLAALFALFLCAAAVWLAEVLSDEARVGPAPPTNGAAR